MNFDESGGHSLLPGLVRLFVLLATELLRRIDFWPCSGLADGIRIMTRALELEESQKLADLNIPKPRKYCKC